MKESELTKSIDKSLKESAAALDALRSQPDDASTKIPRQTYEVETRLLALQDELSSVSDKMLAYKLRRLADSKMLERVSAAVNSEALSSVASSELVSPASSSHTEVSRKISTDKSNETPSFSSTTFQCKSDLDQCLASSPSALYKSLCYALFIRCVIKG